MKRRAFIAALGGAAVWPIAAWAQRPTKLPTIGFFGPVKASIDRLQTQPGQTAPSQKWTYVKKVTWMEFPAWWPQDFILNEEA